jgi:hypothetical protein
MMMEIALIMRARKKVPTFTANTAAAAARIITRGWAGRWRENKRENIIIKKRESGGDECSVRLIIILSPSLFHALTSMTRTRGGEGKEGEVLRPLKVST